MIGRAVHHGTQVANGGGLEALLIDTAARTINPSYGERVATHESGHFLIAYLVGLLPRTYTLSSLDAYKRWAVLILSTSTKSLQALVVWAGVTVKSEICVGRYGALNVQAGTLFCDSAYQQEVGDDRSSEM